MSFRMQSLSPSPWNLWVIWPNDMSFCAEAFKVRSWEELKHQIPLKAGISRLSPCGTWEKHRMKKPHAPSPVHWAGPLQLAGRLWMNFCTLCGAHSSASGPWECVFISFFPFNSESVKKKEFTLSVIEKQKNLVPFKAVLQPQFAVRVPPFRSYTLT